MTCPLCHRSDLPTLLVALLALLCAFAYFRMESRVEGVRVEFEGKLREVAGKQASLILNGATYAVVHQSAVGWDVAEEPLDLTPPAKKDNGGKKK